VLELCILGSHSTSLLLLQSADMFVTSHRNYSNHTDPAFGNKIQIVRFSLWQVWKWEPLHHPDDGGSVHLWNISLLQQDYTVLYPKRSSSKYRSLNCSDTTHIYTVLSSRNRINISNKLPWKTEIIYITPLWGGHTHTAVSGFLPARVYLQG
jgi:hypothetical protein